MGRYDNDDQHSFAHKATAVLTGIVGAAAFHRLGGSEAIAKGVPKLGKFANILMDDLAEVERKDFTAGNINKFYKKHIAGNDSTWKTLKDLSDEKMKLKTSGSNFIGAFTKMLEIERNGKDNVRKLFDTQYADEVIDKLSDKFKFSDELREQAASLTRHVLERDNLTLYHDIEKNSVEINHDMIKQYIDYDKFASNQQRNDFFKDLMGAVEDKNNAFNKYVDEHTTEDGTLDFVDNLKKTMTGKTFGEAYGTTQDESVIANSIKGDRGLTVGDYLENEHKFDDQIIQIGDEAVSLKDSIKTFAEADEDFKNILIDAKNLRIKDDGNVINYQEIDTMRKDALRGIAGTLPGKLAKVTDFLSMEEPGIINVFQKGKFEPLLENSSKAASSNYIQIMNKYYKINENNSFTHIAEMDDRFSMSMKHGTVPRMRNKMFGMDSEYEATNKFTRYFDIGTTTERTVLDEIINDGSILGKVTRKHAGVEQYNIIERMMDAGLAEKDAKAYRDNLKQVSNAFSHITKAPNQKTLEKMEKIVSNEMSQDILKALQTNDQEEIIGTLSRYSKRLKNNDLSSLVKKGIKDRENAAQVLSIKSDRIDGSKNVMKYMDLLKRESFKEVMLSEAINETTGSINYSKMLVSLRRAGVKGESYENAKKLGHWVTFQREGLLFNKDINEKGLKRIKEANQDILSILTAERQKNAFQWNDEFIRDFRQTIGSIKENYSELTTKTTKRHIDAKRIRAKEANDMLIMRKAYTPASYAKDMLKDINDFTKIKAHSKKFGMQFVAGKNSPEYVTTYTMAPYFFTQRLIEPFNRYGLGFSNKHMGSVGSQWKAIMTKRVLPVAAGLTALNYLNYEAKNLTGTSLTGALANGIANTDLGLRKIGDVTGITHILKSERALNPITQYWFGEDYQNSNERKDYYENGYDAVRKGRWWAFGSASEFRGGKISYYQPNFVKRANSDWKDIGVYGSTKEKWAHSWVPTPRHPFAPIRRALDPYWLEKKHYYDRPYMETAPLFSTGTPWGAVLNPTIGEMIKPIRKMHKNETRRGLVDPRTLIRERNERLKAKATDKDNMNLVQISQDGISNIEYKSRALADPNKVMVTLRAGNGRVQSVNYNGVGYEDGLQEISEGGMPQEGVSSQNGGVMGAMNSYVGSKLDTIHDFSLMNAFETTSIGSMISNTIGKVMDSRDIIQSANENIKRVAAGKNDGTVLQKANLATIPFRQATERITTREDETDLLLTTSKHDFINDALFSGKQLGGIYGFIYGTVSGDHGRRLRLANAENMSSFKRGFWDANVGGLGGGLMEIARRFFPHTDHSWTDINSVKNTMPDWMPVRFQTGDPYTKLPKGEMRLPGAGYESIHKLRSDEYGRYGTLDRMRILGDIAPWSEEYKTWRDIAQKTITDTKGKKEIKDIKKRVEKQSKAHEFYNYKFLKNPTEIKDETIESVDGTNIKTLSGKQYSMAGIKLSKDADISNRFVAGMDIKVEHLKKDGDSNGPIAAAVYVNGENLNQSLVKSGEAKGDSSTAIGAKALTGQLGQHYGALMEAIGHAPIPFVHNKLMRIDTPLESYKNERVYGTPYSTWDHPIKGFIEPAFQKSWARGPVGQGLAIGSWALAEHVWKNSASTSEALKKVGINLSETGVNKLASVIFNTMNPGAFAGSMMAAVPTGLMKGEGIKGLLSASTFTAATKDGAGRVGSRLGATAMIAGYGLTRTANPLQSTAIFSVAGVALSKQLQHEKFGGREGAIAGAVTGLTLSALRNPKFNKEKMFGKYTPESTKKRRDIEEYFDRLEYVKYMGLYEKAARKAKSWEHTNIKKITQASEYATKVNKKKIEKLSKRLDSVSNSNLEGNRKAELINKLSEQRNRLSTSKQVFRVGKYTKAAIAYKQAADSTIYGLKEDATSQEVLRAIPKGDKDFFMEFAKEKDKKKQREILKYVSPYERRALQIAWGSKKIDKVKDNEEYFKHHFMPGVFWAGWKPQIDMENVKMKTIENEGMLLSDFGIYESKKNEPAAVIAPSVGQFDNGNMSGLGLQARLQGALNGAGLLGVKVSVSPTSANGIEVMANIANSAKITEYKIREGINKAVGTRMFY